jgi:hypothetical protein
VEDTVGGLGILFDVNAPGVLDFADPNLTIAEADLRVSPEFAAVLETLGNPDLTGADVGNARIDALVVPQVTKEIVVTEFLGGRVNGGRSATFNADDVTTIMVDTGNGSDNVRIHDLHFAGAINVDVSRGPLNFVNINRSVLSGPVSIMGGRFGERVEVNNSWISELNVDMRQGVDLVSVYDTQLGDLNVRSSNGMLQQVAVWRSTITGAMNLNLDGLFTWTNVYYSQLNNLNVDNGRGNDLVSLISTHVARDAFISLDGGWDRVMFFRSSVEGETVIDGGGGWFDRLDSYFSTLGSLRHSGMEQRRI